ncbi:hypothetical protein C8R45DRAFT_966808 [Mycena sanguinolenta]|nr:hypothetical protein C8R45DRAFT_966808 [Mycena sanguinolenta]
MEIALNQLKEQHASLKAPIDAHKALISPMRCIPQDVLLEIFFACLPSEHNALIDPAEAPLVLGHICRHWREVAHSTPMLWSSIHIPSLDYGFTAHDILLQFEWIVKAWLERSDPCPLSVSFYGELRYMDLTEGHPLIFQLLSVSRRLRHLELTGSAKFFGPLLQLGAEDLPLLKSLRVRSIENHPDSLNAFLVPTLEDVALRDMAMPADLFSLALSWSQLTRLCLDCFAMWTEAGLQKALGIREAFAVLEMCPNLVQCEMRLTEEPEANLDIPAVVLPNLDTLVWTGGFPSCISQLVVPNLRFLRIGDAFSRAKASSLPRDGYLSADIDPRAFPTPDDLRGLLNHFPMISHLRLRSTVPGIPLDALALFSPPYNLCPNLIHFTVISPHSDELSDQVILVFVEARMAMPIPLSQLRVRFNRLMQVDVMPELQSFIAEGLEVSLEYSSPRYNFGPRVGLHDLDSPSRFRVRE